MRIATLPITPLQRDRAIDNDTLVRRIEEGDFFAMEVLYHRFAPKIAGILAKLLKNSADIDDAMQETFIEAHRDIAKLNEPKYLERWLVRIAIHRAHHHFRKRRLKRLLGLDRSIDDEPLHLQAKVNASQEALTELVLLDRAFDAMSLSERTCFLLRHLEGYQLKEVAHATNNSVATVKRRIASAMRIIEQHFEEAHHD